MKIKIIRRQSGMARKISKTYKVINFLTKEQSKNLSFAMSEAKNHSEITKNIKSDRIYYVLSRKLILKEGKRKLIAKKGDLVFIPKNTKYYFGGTFKTILINSPAFNTKNEKIFKIK